MPPALAKKCRSSLNFSPILTKRPTSNWKTSGRRRYVLPEPDQARRTPCTGCTKASAGTKMTRERWLRRLTLMPPVGLQVLAGVLQSQISTAGSTAHVQARVRFAAGQGQAHYEWSTASCQTARPIDHLCFQVACNAGHTTCVTEP